MDYNLLVLALLIFGKRLPEVMKINRERYR